MSVPIEIRRYANVSHFAADAAVMAGAGWSPVSQVETTGGVNGAWVILAILVAVIAIVFEPLLLVGTLVLLILAYLARGKSLVVTYRPDVRTQ